MEKYECEHLEAHEQRMCNIENEAKNKVSWVVFVWAIGILTLAFGFGVNYITSLSSKVSTAEVEMAKIQTKLANIEVLLVEIKSDLRTHDTVKK